MKQTIDLIKIPPGYTSDIHEFCSPVLEVAMLRGEKAGTFDDDFFYEVLETHLAENEQRIILHNAHRFLEQKLHFMDREFEPFYEKEFEIGCRHFIRDFLHINQLHTVRGLKSDVWKISIKPLPGNMWQLTAVVG